MSRVTSRTSAEVPARATLVVRLSAKGHEKASDSPIWREPAARPSPQVMLVDQSVEPKGIRRRVALCRARHSMRAARATDAPSSVVRAVPVFRGRAGLFFL
jgi:hypothetical protein